VPTADVAVIGAGLAGLATAVRLAEGGARVAVFAQGNGAIHWAGGPIDVAAVPGTATVEAALGRLAATPGHPYGFLGDDVPAAVGWFTALAEAGGLPHAGALDVPFAGLPTGIGGVRPVAIVPAAQAAALDPWAPDERLVIVGQAGFKDFWPRAIAASLGRPEVWGELGRPARVDGVTVDLPGLAGRHNLNALRIADAFDDPAWRPTALELIAAAVDATGSGPARVALPAVLGRIEHAAALREAIERLGRPVIEVPLVPPGIPGLRLYRVLRDALRARGGRILLGEPVARVDARDGRVVSVATTAAARHLVTRVGALVLATGGIAGGGLVGETDGRIVETVLGLPTEGPPIDRWVSGDPLEPGALPIATSGLRTDAALRPVDPALPGGGALLENVVVVGGMLAGQNWMRERCGDGIALASAWRAAATLAGGSPRTALAGTAAGANGGRS
jgi:glycerol-3-phosphate dehydrogenase subunit B